MNSKPQFKKDKIILTAVSGIKYYFYLIHLKNTLNKKLFSQSKRGYKIFIDAKNDKLILVRRFIRKNSLTEEYKISSLISDKKIPAQCSPSNSLALKTKLFKTCNDILESLGLFPSKQEMEFSLYNSSWFWLREAKNYYNSAKILERNYLKVLKDNIIDHSNKRHMEADGTFKVIIFLYSLSVECILKAKILAIFEDAKLYLNKKNAHITKVSLKNWIYNNIYTHDSNQLAKICGCIAERDSKMLSIISYFIETGKYPVIQHKNIYFTATIRTKPIENFWTKRDLRRFELFLVKIAKKCFGKNMEKVFSEQSLESFHKSDLKKADPIKRKTEIIRMIKLGRKYSAHKIN